MKAQHIKAIIVEPFHDRRIAEKVASATGSKVVDFSQFPGGLPGTDSYVKLIDTLISRLAAALKSYVGGNVLADRGLRPVTVVAGLSRPTCRPTRDHLLRRRH